MHFGSALQEQMTRQEFLDPSDIFPSAELTINGNFKDPWMPLHIDAVNGLTHHMFGYESFKDPLLQPTKYLVVPSPDCRRVRFLVIVFTAPDDFESRDRWRRIYGGQRMRHKFGYCVIFPIGRLQDEHENSRLNEEINFFDDILQGDYVESYRNVTLKSLSALRFIAVAYPRVELIMKIDDDVAWNVPKVSNYISRALPRSISCYKYVSYDEYPHEKFPQHCSGIAYMLDREALLPMLNAVPKLDHFWIDDVFITGFLTRDADISFVEINRYIELEPLRRKFPDKVFYDDMMFYGTSKENIGRQFVARTWYVTLLIDKSIIYAP
ncbi:N-acetyllactosaminide 3-alpha-galactosyltransferase [Ancylostoma duodenale]|uniref:Hexosyltransferase n=1 Tax=Ancylostoma duodenale TaxID=51022 RepID=A0A0C2BUC0_9BILA|nr:N-acetyllactosaminide 3-alpha-galactosyltransferase [Ancylostoma duodenale]